MKTKTKAAHTPGPWYVVPEMGVKPDDRGRWSYIMRNPGGDGMPIATLYVKWGPGEANANLLAAAPDLLEVAKWAESFLAELGNDGNGESDLLRNIRAAVARAEGSV